MNNSVEKYAERGEEFFPTPDELIDRMISGVDWKYVKNILEPSAGKGDIAYRILSRNYEKLYGNRTTECFGGVNVDCCEIDPHLAAILRYRFGSESAAKYQSQLDALHQRGDSGFSDRGAELTREMRICGGNVRLVCDDFLRYQPLKEYDLIIMNPPFSDGCTHLLKALEIQKRGGAVICLLNAETIRNPYTAQRKELRRLLDEYGASIEYIENAFAHAERRTDVEIALIKVFIPRVEEKSDFYESMRKAEKLDDDFGENPSTELDVTDYIKSAVAHFRVEARAGIELIQQFRAFRPYMRKSINPSSPYEDGAILHLTDTDRVAFEDASVNSYLEKVRLKYWAALLQNPKFTGKLTSKLCDDYRKRVDGLKGYDFTEYNIRVLSAKMMAQVKSGIEDEIAVMFDRLTADHTWSPECAANRHYFDGWATNTAWKIGKKVIIPCRGVFSEYTGEPRKYDAIEVLSDIEKILNFFDGNMTADVDLGETISRCFDEGRTRNIPCKFFSATFYKKGTVHLVFNCPELIERFNIYAAQNRGWLPPTYGRKKYSDMDADEKKVVNSFQGEAEYEKILENRGFYLASPTGSGVSLLEGAV